MAILLRIANVVFSYAGPGNHHTSWSLQIPDLTIQDRTFYSLVGSNMVGKTTLLRLLFGLEPLPRALDSGAAPLQVSGDLLASGFQSNRGAITLAPAHTAFLSHYDRMFPELSLWENVRVAKTRGSEVSLAEARRRFRCYLKSIPIFAEVSERNQLSTLSSGGQALLRLARAYSWRARLILIDEVTAHLDDANSTSFMVQLTRLVTQNCSVVLVSHREADHESGRQLACDAAVNYVKLRVSQSAHTSCLA